MKTLKQIFAEHDYGNTEWEQSFAPMLIEWLTQKRQHFINKHKFCDDVKQSMDELLEELEG